MYIKGREISSNNFPLIIAEIGINHGGSLDVAKNMVYEAAKSGAECVKHQTHFVEDEMTEDAKQIFRRVGAMDVDSSEIGRTFKNCQNLSELSETFRHFYIFA